jgi:putative endonuclease
METAKATTAAATIPTKTLHKQGVRASVRFLENRGYTSLKVAEGEKEYDIVATDPDNNALVFVRVAVSTNQDEGFPTEAIKGAHLKAMEQAAINYIASAQEDTERMVRFDQIAVLVIAESRAILRHHINAIDISRAAEEGEAAA